VGEFDGGRITRFGEGIRGSAGLWVSGTFRECGAIDAGSTLGPIACRWLVWHEACDCLFETRARAG
jgi:hypothetical protein